MLCGHLSGSAAIFTSTRTTLNLSRCIDALWGNLHFTFMCGTGVVAKHSKMEGNQAKTRLINVSDGLWHWAAVSRLSVSSQAAQ